MSGYHFNRPTAPQPPTEEPMPEDGEPPPSYDTVISSSPSNARNISWDDSAIGLNDDLIVDSDVVVSHDTGEGDTGRRGRTERGTLTKFGLYWRLSVIVSVGLVLVVAVAGLVYVIVDLKNIKHRLENIDTEAVRKLQVEVDSLNGTWGGVMKNITQMEERFRGLDTKFAVVEQRLEEIKQLFEGDTQKLQVDVESLNGAWVNIRKSIVEMEDKLGVFEQRIREDNIKMEMKGINSDGKIVSENVTLLGCLLCATILRQILI